MQVMLIMMEKTLLAELNWNLTPKKALNLTSEEYNFTPDWSYYNSHQRNSSLGVNLTPLKNTVTPFRVKITPFGVKITPKKNNSTLRS